jgi:virginiamycin B lyase
MDIAGPRFVWLTHGGMATVGDVSGGSITRITPAGTITQFPAPSEVNDPYDITSGPDGRLWFTERTFGRGIVNVGFVASITINGTINETRIETAAFSITRGPDDSSPAHCDV